MEQNLNANENNLVDPIRSMHEELLIDLKQALGDKISEKRLLRKVAKLEKFSTSLSKKAIKMFEEGVRNEVKLEKEFLVKATEAVAKEEEFDDNVINLCAAVAQKTELLRKTKEEKFALENELRDSKRDIAALSEAFELLNNNECNISHLKETVEKLITDYSEIKNKLTG